MDTWVFSTRKAEEGEACVVPGAPDCGSGTGAGGCPAAASSGDGGGDAPRFL